MSDDTNTNSDVDRHPRHNRARNHTWLRHLTLTLTTLVLALLIATTLRLADTPTGRTILTWFTALGTSKLILAAGIATATITITTAWIVIRNKITHSVTTARWSTRVFLLGALIGVTVSGDTSWRFFTERAHITSIPERAAIFAGVEIVLIGCGLAMYENARTNQPIGPARWVAWLLCGFSAYAALTLDGFPAGPFRVAAGPVVSLIALHLALGIEIRVHHTTSNTPWHKVLSELRERALSWLGLGDDSRDAATRTRHRAAIKAARLTHTDLSGKTWITRLRRSRVRRKLLRAQIAQDIDTRAVFEATLQLLRESDQWMRAARSPHPRPVRKPKPHHTSGAEPATEADTSPKPADDTTQASVTPITSVGAWKDHQWEIAVATAARIASEGREMSLNDLIDALRTDSGKGMKRTTAVKLRQEALAAHHHQNTSDTAHAVGEE